MNVSPATPLAALLLVIVALASAPADDAISAKQALDDKFAAELAALAGKCDELGLPDEAETTRRWFIRRAAGRQYLFLPEPTSPAPKPGATQIKRQWHDRFVAIRAAHAAELFKLAQQAAAQGQATSAYGWLYEALREDPDHAEARRVLGYAKNSRGQWQQAMGTPAAAPGGLDHPKFGWRRRSYWRLETPHYNVLTNHSPQAAVDLGRRLEDLYDLWQQIFFNYWSNEAALVARLGGGREPLARPRPKMNVVLFRNREEYIRQLSPAEPKIALTLGIYMDGQQTVFFYAGDESLHATWQHEAAHQLFQECQVNLVSPGRERNFWIVEGAAMYLESLSPHEGYWTVGGIEADRLQFARYRALAGDFAMPLQELCALGRDDVQNSPDIRKLYAHSAGLAQFLLVAQEGKFRDAALAYLAAIYQGRDALDTLSQLTSTEPAALDEQYRRFLNVTDADLAAIPSPHNVRNLSLGGTSVTDAGLASLSECTNLVWLDLSLTGITDAGLSQLKGAARLQQLFLEQTEITDASLATIGQFRELEELDLSRVAISDEGLAALAGLKKLKTLYVTGCDIGDAGLAHLRNLKQLGTLETSGTKVTAAGLKQLRATNPKLRDTNTSP